MTQEKIKVLHIVKTVNGANWAVDQVTELVKLGVEVHVCIPELGGTFYQQWIESGAIIHLADLNFKSISSSIVNIKLLKRLIVTINPDIIHSHFFLPTIILRVALNKKISIPLVFQVPGPMHLEHFFFRMCDILTARVNDFWIASSKYTFKLYLKAKVSENKLYLSYYGNKNKIYTHSHQLNLRKKFLIDDKKYVVGNINYMYPPRWYLGQLKGIKRHEDVINALAMLGSLRQDAVGVLIGGQWGAGKKYEKKLTKMASGIKTLDVIMTGKLLPIESKLAWSEFNLAIHIPSSENCGGVIEPLMSEVPVIASDTGGLPEVIINNITGVIVNANCSLTLANAINQVLSDLPRHKQMAKKGKMLVQDMFNVERTALEVKMIYEHILGLTHTKPKIFDSEAYAKQL